jgi:hypothetical protein
MGSFLISHFELDSLLTQFSLHLTQQQRNLDLLGSSYFRQVGPINVTDDTSNTEEKNFGQSVSMSDDGRTIAVSGVCTDWTTGLHFYRVKVFEEVDNVSWSQKGASIDSDKTSTYLDDARADVSLSGDGLNVAVSTVYIKDRDSSLAADTTPEGSVFVYNFNSSNAWDLASTFSGDDTDGGIPGDYVGLKVSLDGTGSKVAIGVQYHDGTGGGGDQDSGQVLVCTIGDATCQVIATGTPGDRVGSSVMISSSGSSSSCVVFGSVGSDSNGTDSGSASVLCEKDTDGTITWVNRGVQLVGEAAGDEFGFSVAISSDSNFIAIGSRLNDPSDDKKDAGNVRVFQLEPSSLNYVKIGDDIDGERGERSDKDTAKYYVGDYSGYSIALSDKREDNKLHVVVGAPNNAGDDGYYNGHVRLYECDLTSTTPLSGSKSLMILMEGPGKRLQDVVLLLVKMVLGLFLDLQNLEVLVEAITPVQHLFMSKQSTVHSHLTFQQHLQVRYPVHLQVKYHL